MNYPFWVGRLSASLQVVLDAIDHPDDDEPLPDSVAVQLARKYLAELDLLTCPSDPVPMPLTEEWDAQCKEFGCDEPA